MAAVHRGFQHRRKAFQHAADLQVAVHAGLPVDDFQRIIEKMRVDLALQRHNAGVAQRKLLFINMFKLVEQGVAHRVKAVAQCAHFAAGQGRLLDLHAKAAKLYLPCRGNQRVNRAGDLAGKKAQYKAHHGQ